MMNDRLTFSPSETAIATFISEWGWLLPESITPLLFSRFGDVFYEDSEGRIYWLNTGTAEISLIAPTAMEFRDLLGTDLANEWFLSPVVDRLHTAGKIPGPDQCYTFIVLPIFSEASYDVTNFAVVPVIEHFVYTGSVHRQMRDLPDGTKVNIKVVP